MENFKEIFVIQKIGAYERKKSKGENKRNNKSIVNKLRIRKRLNRIKRKIKGEEMIKEKKEKYGILIILKLID